MTAGSHYDLVIIGAGPAGMAAAIEASEGGLRALILDDQPAPGGQVYRHVLQNAVRREASSYLGGDYWSGQALADAFAASSAELWSESRVWQITGDREVFFTRQGAAQRVSAGAILIATGAMERPMPVRGWTLPGVMSVGAAQTMLKTTGSGADGAVFAGSGPLFYLTIWQYLQAGLAVRAVVDTAPARMTLAQYWLAMSALLQPGLLLKGLRWRAGIRWKTDYFVQATSVAINGEDRVTGLSFTDASGQRQTIPAEHLFIHQGVVPNTSLTMASDLAHRWCPRQLCWHPGTDMFGESSVAGIFVAGDGMGIAGAAAAVSSGRLAARRIIARAGGRALPMGPVRRFLKWRQAAIRPFLDSLFRPPDEWRVPQDDKAIVCRCEALTKADVAAAIALGVSGPNQLKGYCRAGMGRCQGRMCALTIQKMIHDHGGQPEDRVGHLRIRPPIRPLTVGELAALANDDAGA
jgi:thioredoxin reductase/bacterioferritin-associated ferredoxin